MPLNTTTPTSVAARFQLIFEFLWRLVLDRMNSLRAASPNTPFAQFRLCLLCILLLDELRLTFKYHPERFTADQLLPLGDLAPLLGQINGAPVDFSPLGALAETAPQESSFTIFDYFYACENPASCATAPGQSLAEVGTLVSHLLYADFPASAPQPNLDILHLLDPVSTPSQSPDFPRPAFPNPQSSLIPHSAFHIPQSSVIPHSAFHIPHSLAPAPT